MNIKLAVLRAIRLIMHTVIWVVGLIIVLFLCGSLNHILHFGKTTNLYFGTLAIGGYITLTVYVLSRIGKIGGIIYYMAWVIALPIILQTVHKYCIEHNIRSSANDLTIVITFAAYIAITTIPPLILWPKKTYTTYTYKDMAKVATGFGLSGVYGVFSLVYYIFAGIGYGIVFLLRGLGLAVAVVIGIGEVVLPLLGGTIVAVAAVGSIILVIGLIAESCH